MSKKNLTFIGLIVVIICIAIVCFYLALNNKDRITLPTDSEKMQEEYASLNGQQNVDGKSYPIVLLSDNNPFVYQTSKEIVDRIKSGTGLIYLGYPESSYCRTFVNALDSVSKSSNMTTVYYLNMKNIEDTIELDDNDEVIVTSDGSNDYYVLLQMLDKYLTEYTLTGKDGKNVDTLEKRINVPTLIAVLNGQIISVHNGTVESQTDGFVSLSNTEEQELEEMIKKMLDEVGTGICTKEGC